MFVLKYQEMEEPVCDEFLKDKNFPWFVKHAMNSLGHFLDAFCFSSDKSSCKTFHLKMSLICMKMNVEHIS